MTSEIDAAVAAADAAVRPLLERVNIADLARYNAGYARYGDARFEHFVGDERGRFMRATQLVTSAKPRGARIVDLGSFIPHLPITLARLGYQVAIVERFDLYGPSFQAELERLASREGIDVIDLDLSSDDLDRLGESDVVLLMAVLEHLLGSPAPLLRRIREALRDDGIVLIDVPNIAELGKRLGLLRGKSPLAPYADYLASAYPFSGHHREMTAAEVRQLLEATGYAVDRLEVYDYSPAMRLAPRARLIRKAKRLLPPSFARRSWRSAESAIGSGHEVDERPRLDRGLGWGFGDPLYRQRLERGLRIRGYVTRAADEAREALPIPSTDFVTPVTARLFPDSHWGARGCRSLTGLEQDLCRCFVWAAVRDGPERLVEVDVVAYRELLGERAGIAGGEELAETREVDAFELEPRRARTRSCPCSSYARRRSTMMSESL